MTRPDKSGRKTNENNNVPTETVCQRQALEELKAIHKILRQLLDEIKDPLTKH